MTPSYLSPSIEVFYELRMIQSALMGQYVLLHPKANSKLQALLRGVPFSRIFFCASRNDFLEALTCFKHREAVYIRFSHISNFQPKFYIGSIPLRLFWTGNIHDTGNSCKSNRINSYWPKSPYGSGVDSTISGCGRFFRFTPKNQTFGL